MRIKTRGGVEIFGGNTPQTNFEGLGTNDVVVSLESEGCIRLVAPFLNPGDEIRGHLRMANVPTQTEVNYRAPGVKLSLVRDYDQDREKVYSNMIIELAKRSLLLDFYLKLTSLAYREMRKRDEP
ncbi:hypothetical protein [Thioalkalivibrio sp. ARh4]|nr:hypothetical protein [Thioalkalivibrio sp. ARh4]